jgi:hypothetical protein
VSLLEGGVAALDDGVEGSVACEADEPADDCELAVELLGAGEPEPGPPDGGDDKPLAEPGADELGAIDVATVLAGVGSVGAGGEDSVTTGACPTAFTSAATTGALADVPAVVAAAA